MGDCISKRSAKLKEEVDSSKTVPYFRQESLLSRLGQLSDNECPWKERLSYEDIFGRLSSKEKETVLHNKWWKSPDTVTEETPVEADYLDSLYMLEDDEDHYDQINESEIIKPFIETKKKAQQNKMFRIPPPMSKRLPPPPVKIQLLEPIIINESTTDISNISEREAMDICLEYSEMVKIFRPLIVQNLLVHDILPHLPFLENHDDIYTEMKIHSPKNAVVSLLDELERSKELGKWHKFIDALSACGYTYIVDNIRGYKFISHEYQREYIRKLTPKISKMIAPAELLPHLLAKDIISDSDNENIQREDTNRGNIAASVLLLDRITRKHRYWYKLFMEALLDAGMEDVAADLEIPELLENKRKKVTDVNQTEDDVPYDLPPNPPSWTYRTRAPPLELSRTTFESSDDTCYGIYSHEKDRRPLCTRNEQALPLPPRIPLKGKRKVLPPVLTNAYDSDDGGYEMYADNTDRYAGQVSAPTLHTDGLHGDGKKQTVDICVVNKCNDTKYKDLIDNIEEIQDERNDILFEVDLLQQKFTLHEEVICGLRKRRLLREEIALKEKEKQVLHSDDSFQEEKTLTDDETDAYYPTGKTVNNENEQRTPVTGHSIKRTIDYRPSSEEGNLAISRFLSVDAYLPLSTVQLYSPTFDSKSKISQLFEQDSGIGRDIELEVPSFHEDI